MRSVYQGVAALSVPPGVRDGVWGGRWSCLPPTLGDVIQHEAVPHKAGMLARSHGIPTAPVNK